MENNSKNVQVIQEEFGSDKSINIPESAQDKIYNSIVRIEMNNFFGTGFFIKLNIQNKILKCLITCFHVIKKNENEINESIDIFYGKKNNETKKVIKLDKSLRFVKYFNKPEDSAIIQIIDDDEIPDDKFLLPDLNYKNLEGYKEYININLLLAGYPDDPEFQKERHISSGKISKIKNFEFEHFLHTETGSSGSPLCLYGNQHVIGIHQGGNIRTRINYGIFIGYIIEKLENIDLNEKNPDIIEINPFQILNINEQEFTESYYLADYYKSFKDNKNIFLACFILENFNRYKRKGNIFLIMKDHFYYTIMNDIKNLKVYLERNSLAIFEKDSKGRTLLFLSVLGYNYDTINYLLQSNINEWGANYGIPLDVGKEKIDDILNSKESNLNYNERINSIALEIYLYALSLPISVTHYKFIYDELLKNNLIIKKENIIKDNHEIGIRLIRNNKYVIDNNINLYDYEKVYHVAKYNSIEPIMRLGLKKPKNPLRGHFTRNYVYDGNTYLFDAIFVSPSIFYASYRSDYLYYNGFLYKIIFEGKVKKTAFTTHKSTERDYKLKSGEPENIEYCITDEKDIIITSLLLVNNCYLTKLKDYEESNIFL